MGDPAEESPGESLEDESLETPPNADNQEEDTQKKQDQGQTINQTGHRTADQNAQRVFREPEPIVAGQADHRVSERVEDSPYDQADLTYSKASNQTEQVAYGQIDRQVPGLIDRKTSEQTERRFSRQPDRRTSEQADRKMSTQGERRVSKESDRRISSQAEKRTSEQIDERVYIPFDPRVTGQTDGTYDQAERETFETVDQRLSRPSDPGTSEQTDSSLAGRKASEKVDQADHRSSVKSLSKTSDQVEKPIFDQADSHADQLKGGKDENGELDQPEGKAYLSSHGSEYGLFPHFLDSTESHYRVQPCKFEESQTDLKTTLSAAVETESTTTVQSYHPTDSKLTGSFPTKDHVIYQRSPSISSKLDITIPDKIQVTQINHFQNDYSESEQENSSYIPNQPYKRRFPPIVYEDPYEVSLRYMEKHHILQIFQITENLVYEKPEDPLNFMLEQVQEMMKSRDKM